MKKGWPLLAAGLGIYALALLVIAPATLADLGLRRASDGRMRLAEARGTLWSGSATLEVRDAAGRTALSEPLAWRVRPAPALRGRLAYEVALEPGSPPASLIVSGSRIELANAELSVPAAALGLASPMLAALDLAGVVRLKVPNLTLERRAARGNATLRWDAAGSARSPVFPLGDYEMRVEAKGTEGLATLQTLKGPLQLRGQGSWGNGRAPTFVAVAEVPAELREQLAPFLRLIAVERGAGRFDLRFR
jgi:general secretion pathway protein N